MTANQQQSIDVECQKCAATGVSKSRLSKSRAGTACDNCEGTGKVELTFTPFTGRKTRSDVDFVRPFGQIYPDNDNRVEGQVTYQEFLDGGKPQTQEEIFQELRKKAAAVVERHFKK